MLEREEPLEGLSRLAAASLEGRGSVAVVVGGAGEGKTALLAAIGELGRGMGYRVWRAAGSTLERPFAYLCRPGLSSRSWSAPCAVPWCRAVSVRGRVGLCVRGRPGLLWYSTRVGSGSET